MEKLFIFGQGGQARELAGIASALRYKPVLLSASNPPGLTNAHGLDVIAEERAVELTGAVFAIGIGDNTTRARVAARYGDRLAFPSLLHPDASFGLGQREQLMACKGVVVQAGVRMTTNIAVGDFCNFNLNATVSHDCRIGAFSTLSPGACVAGSVHLGVGVWIGIGAVVSNGSDDNPLVIGDNAVIGAGAVVIRDCEADAVYVGIPARRIR